jgi:hypothetical protein
MKFLVSRRKEMTSDEDIICDNTYMDDIKWTYKVKCQKYSVQKKCINILIKKAIKNMKESGTKKQIKDINLKGLKIH